MLLVVILATTNPIFVNGGKGFHVETFFKATFFQASTYCSRLGMELVSFNNQQEFDEVKNYIVRNVPNVKWNQFWTSGVATGPLKFGWQNTGLPVTILGNWEFLQLSNLLGLENCLEVKLHGVR
ncbi:PREDICTED: uncharacterized protein LOC108556594 [Nicrophorus vespilloides]|uniref:Uncharacterized protein LOC108556594 n=1 Tax=Nicrophorus vespilloides TaxID=110193 RepID=A0ABM1M103_NICVS|nr:PREDICTED: uncharacterized protein LOC108556594 [Nicrophorus vespilloides]